jgi:hypothetical protein
MFWMGRRKMINDGLLKAIAEAHRMHRTARREAYFCKQHLETVVGDFIAWTHTVADLVDLLEMVAEEVGRPEAGHPHQLRGLIKQVSELTTRALSSCESRDPLANPLWDALRQIEGLLEEQ